MCVRVCVSSQLDMREAAVAQAGRNYQGGMMLGGMMLGERLLVVLGESVAVLSTRRHSDLRASNDQVIHGCYLILGLHQSSVSSSRAVSVIL